MSCFCIHTIGAWSVERSAHPSHELHRAVGRASLWSVVSGKRRGRTGYGRGGSIVGCCFLTTDYGPLARRKYFGGIIKWGIPPHVFNISEARLYAEFCLLRGEAEEAAIYLGARSLAPSSSLPDAVILSPKGEEGAGHSTTDTLFGLAPRGVYTAVPVARSAVSSYLAISPLPRPGSRLY